MILTCFHDHQWAYRVNLGIIDRRSPSFTDRETNMQSFENLKKLVNEAEDDLKKGFGGNKAAKVRSRKKMQEIKAAAQQIREELLDAADPADKKPGEADD